MGKLLTVKQASRKSGYAVKTLYCKASQRLLFKKKVRGRVYFDSDEMQAIRAGKIFYPDKQANSCSVDSDEKHHPADSESTPKDAGRQE